MNTKSHQQAALFARGAVSLNTLRPSARPVRAARVAAVTTSMMEIPSAPAASLDGYGEHCFRGAVANKYLSKYGETDALLKDVTWPSQDGKADIVAKAVLDWAVDNGASVYCHWFQPMAASGVRHGLSAQVQQTMYEFDNEGTPFFKFDGEMLLQGETDGSSYPNGGMRATHTAGGYLSLDPLSPIFLREDTIFIPAAFVSYNGDALDEKVPLHRAVEAMSTQGTRLLKLMGYEVDGLINNIGLEQEIFLVPRHAFYRRPDLQFTGRTVMGKQPARGQEMSDHYMAPISRATTAFDCMRQIQMECFKIGIPLKTRHREVAPNQYEFAPLFGNVISQNDQNLMVMQIIEEVASENGLAALLQEKPFAGINGSGKHNNWSLGTNAGVNLLNPKQINAASANPEIFPVIMAAIVSAIDKHGDLMRLSITSPGNDFRLGAMEAPPAVMSTYLGEDMTQYLMDFMETGTVEAYAPAKKSLGFGASAIPKIQVPAEDRNRTSPFPYGGARFEFRAAGSAQNVSLVNTVLNTITAEAFAIVADRIEAGETPTAIAQDLLKAHSRVIHNGNGYDPEWPEQAVEKGLWRIDSGVDAIQRFTDPKNTELFEKMGVLTPRECEARRVILLEHYVGTVEMETVTMVDMINQHVIPSCKKAELPYVKKLEDAVKTLRKAVEGIHAAADEAEAAALCRVLRLDTMIKVRDVCDEAEGLCPPSLWTLATYSELLFLDTFPEGDFLL
jgi:glutamine synthetase